MNSFVQEGRRGTVAEYTDPYISFNEGLGRVEDQGSLSGSEEDAGVHPLYLDANKMDTDIDGELCFIYSNDTSHLNNFRRRKHLADVPNLECGWHA